MKIIPIPINKDDDANYYDDNLSLLKQHMNMGTPVFMLVYMKECGACEHVRPIWQNLPNQNFNNILPNKNKDIVIADIVYELLTDDILKPTPNSYPTIKYINNNKIKDYDNYTTTSTTDSRTLESFMEWIGHELKHAKHSKFNGGKRKKSRKSRKTKKINKTKKSKYSRKSKRTRK